MSAAPGTMARPSLRGRLARLAARSPSLAVGGLMTAALVLAGAFAPWIAPWSPIAVFPQDALHAPSAAYWFGTDGNGMDVYSRTLFGIRYAYGIALPSVAIGLALGVPIGLVAGHLGGFVDEAALRVLDVIRSFPAIILAMAVVAATGSSMTNLVLVIGFIEAPLFARMVRSEVLQLRAGGLVDAAVAAGNPTWRIIFVHLMPNTLRGTVSQLAPRVALAVRVSATLAFVGIGVQAPAPEWGAMIRLGSENVATGEWWIAAFPGLALIVLVLACTILGDGLQEMMDPRRRGRG
jgi:peptide/nickel transport system permease protein